MVITSCSPCHKHLGLLGLEQEAAHFWTRVDLLPVSKALHTGRQTPPTPLSPCQPRWAEGGAGTPCPGPSLQAVSRETLRGRDAFSLEGGGGEGRERGWNLEFGGTPTAFFRAGIYSPQGCQSPGPGRTVPLAEEHFGAPDCRGQHGDGLAPSGVTPTPGARGRDKRGEALPVSLGSGLGGQRMSPLCESDMILLWPFSG